MRGALESVVVTSDREDAGVEMSRRMLLWVFGITLLCGIPIAWFVWEVLGVIFYVAGLFNSALVFMAGPLLFPAVFVVGILLSRQLVLRLLHRFGYDTRWIRHGVLAILIVSVVATPGGLALAGLGSDPWGMFAKGIGRYVERRADISAIQDWLGTLDPEDCQEQSLAAESIAESASSRWSKSVPVPPSLAWLDCRGSRLFRDEAGRPAVRLFLGGQGMIGSWGLAVGHKDMPTPPSDYSEHGERRYPMAPGAYIWFAE